MPRSLHRQVAEAARRDRVSLNQFICAALAGAVRWPADAAAERDDKNAALDEQIRNEYLFYKSLLD
jgi:HicB family